LLLTNCPPSGLDGDKISSQYTKNGRKNGWHTFRGLPRETKNQKAMSVKIQPLADRVVVEPAAAEQKTAGGIIIPDTAKEKPQKGTIVAVGAGKKDEPMTVKVGDNVLYGKYAGTEITIEGKDYLIMRESDLFAII
jgi:chaperonin GroES